MNKLIAIGLTLLAVLATQPTHGQPQPAPGPTPFLVTTSGGVAALKEFDLEWSQGEPFVGAADGAASTSHGYQQLGENQGPTALVPASSGLSLIVMGRAGAAYKFRFDETRARYFVKLFAGHGRLLRIFVVYPGQEELSLPFSKLPAGPVFLSVYNEAGTPLQSFKLFHGLDT